MTSPRASSLCLAEASTLTDESFLTPRLPTANPSTRGEANREGPRLTHPGGVQARPLLLSRLGWSLTLYSQRAGPWGPLGAPAAAVPRAACGRPVPLLTLSCLAQLPLGCNPGRVFRVAGTLLPFLEELPPLQPRL